MKNPFHKKAKVDSSVRSYDHDSLDAGRKKKKIQLCKISALRKMRGLESRRPKLLLRVSKGGLCVSHFVWIVMASPTALTLAAILSDLGSLRACPPALRAGVLSENGTGLSTLSESAMNEEDELIEEEAVAEGPVGQVQEVLRLKKRVETWVKRDGEGEKSLKDVEEVEGKVREVLVEMSRYTDV